MLEISPNQFIPTNIKPVKVNLSGKKGKQILVFDYQTEDGKERRTCVAESEGDDPIASLEIVKQVFLADSIPYQPSKPNKVLVVPNFIKNMMSDKSIKITSSEM